MRATTIKTDNMEVVGIFILPPSKKELLKD